MQNRNLIIAINLGDHGSTGNIMLNTLEYAHKNGDFDVVACVPFKTVNQSKVPVFEFQTHIGPLKRILYKLINSLFYPIYNDGNYFNECTKKLIAFVKKYSKNYNKTIIHLHNLHHSNLNVSKLYKYLKKSGYIVFYTIHDCWSFTGGCYYYDYLPCSKWQNDCKSCPLKIKSSSRQLFKRTSLLLKIKNLTLLPVSYWANNEILKSKLRSIPSIVVWGETSLNPIVFNHNRFKRDLGVQNKKILLCVSAYWNDWKGKNYIYDIARTIPNEYALIVIGKFDKKDYSNIIQINNVEQRELSKFYTIADVYLSLSKSEQLGLTTCEAQLCGTPVVGFGNGGSRETFISGKTGFLVDNGNINQLIEKAKYIIDKKPFKITDIKTSGERFKKYSCAKKMLEIYNQSIYEKLL